MENTPVCYAVACVSREDEILGEGLLAVLHTGLPSIQRGGGAGLLDYSNYRDIDLRICHVRCGKSVALVMLARRFITVIIT